jgi:hypothetical protein
MDQPGLEDSGKRGAEVRVREPAPEILKRRSLAVYWRSRDRNKLPSIRPETGKRFSIW